jgi:hypothetical protein
MNPIFSRNDSVRLSDTAASAHSSSLFDGPDAPRMIPHTVGPSNRPTASTALADDPTCRPRCGNSLEDGVDLGPLVRGPLGRPSAQPSAVATDDPTSRPRCGNFPEDGIDLGPETQQAQQAADRLRRQADRVSHENADLIQFWSRDLQPGLDSSAGRLRKEAERLLRELTQARWQRA